MMAATLANGRHAEPGLPMLSLAAAAAQADQLATRTFNEGCDARIAGTAITNNPYSSGTSAHQAWRRGWRDVHRTWGLDRRGRYPVRDLPFLTDR